MSTIIPVNDRKAVAEQFTAMMDFLLHAKGTGAGFGEDPWKQLILDIQSIPTPQGNIFKVSKEVGEIRKKLGNYKEAGINGITRDGIMPPLFSEFAASKKVSKR